MPIEANLSSVAACSAEAKSLVVVGGAVLDITCSPLAKLLSQTSNPANIHFSWGGVGRNIAEATHRLGVPTFLVSAIARDITGKALIQNCEDIGLSTSLLISLPIPQNTTGTYVSSHDETGEMVHAYADMKICDQMTPSVVMTSQSKQAFQKAGLVLLDANLPSISLLTISEFCHTHNVPVWFESVSIKKCGKILETHANKSQQKAHSQAIHYLSYLSANEAEVLFLSQQLPNPTDRWVLSVDVPPHLGIPSSTVEAAVRVLRYAQNIKCLFVTLGAKGSIYLVRSTHTKTIDCHHTPAIAIPNIVSVSGAGDSFSAGCAAAILRGKSLRESAQVGAQCAALSLQTIDTISTALSPSLLGDCSFK